MTINWYTLRKTEYIQIVLNQTLVPQKDPSIFLRMHLDSRLNWKNHVHRENIQIKEKREIAPLVSRTQGNYRKQTLLYVTIIKPICTNRIQLRSCVSKSYIDKLYRCQNIALRIIIAPYRFESNGAIHRCLQQQMEFKDLFANTTDMRLNHHVNPMAIQLLENFKDIRRLKRLKQYDLV